MRSLIKIFGVAVMLGLAFQSSPSYADRHGHERGHERGHHSYHYREHSSLGIHFNFLPDGYFSVWPGRSRYYYVSQPMPVIVQSAVTAFPVVDMDDSFTVNIPNVQGTYTAVFIKKSGNGFAGPQGEFYPEFPKISQLKAMYGK